MELPKASSLDTQALESAVSGAVAERQQAACAEFVRLFFHHYPTEDMSDRDEGSVQGLLAWLWRHIASDAKLPSVEVFNPATGEHGWQCPHTLVVVRQRDMPFLVDSIRIELAARNIPIHSIKSTPYCAERVDGELVGVGGVQSRETPAEALIYLEVGSIVDETQLEDLRQALQQVLAQVEQVVANYSPLKAKMQQVADQLDAVKTDNKLVDCAQTQEFLRWLADDHFTFMAYTELDLDERNGREVLVECKDQRLGLFDDASKTKTKALDDAHPGVSRFYLSPASIAFSKSPVRSRVHRSAYPDYVVVKRYDEQGKVCGESRFLGLYTSSVYNISPSRIPLLQDKIAQVYERMGLNPWSHEGKALEQVIETYPRDELFQSSASELYETLKGILAISERYQVRLFIRKDRFGKFVSALVYVPRDLFSTRVRLDIQRHLAERVGACDEQFNTFFSESVLARVHLVFRVPKDRAKEFDAGALEQEVTELVRSWDDRFFSALSERHDEAKARLLFSRYQYSFSEAYREAYSSDEATEDINVLESMGERPLSLDISVTGSGQLCFKLFYREQPLALSDVIPVLENFGLRVVSEHPYKLKCARGEVVWLHDFSLAPQSVDQLESAPELLQQAFYAVWQGKADNDAFNKLVVGAGLEWHKANILRVYAAYMRQTLFSYGFDYIAEALVNQSDLARQLCELFADRFDPDVAADADTQNARRRDIEASLEAVPSLSEDRIVRHYLALIFATVRTNFYQAGERDYLAFKLAPASLIDIPEPKPLYEIFVFSPRFEGLHLRGGKVARGGLRWSDRLQDYRTEVLGLVKAQQVKNAVIVPSGAKGGFVCKRAMGMDRGQRAEEGIACYKEFIQALLDLTDNLVDGKVEPPASLVRRDDDDPYLVVAADKGTASFSDTANAIAERAGFWLGDGFASGGSRGYDHKAMGITAKGAWVCVQRHFKELGVDVQNDPITVVGVGDMAGDVFGNGMLLSRSLKLTAAFNHLHIFVDPNPDPEKSFAERERLFNTPGSQWSDYDRALISEGGGVFDRTAKSIAISDAMRERFAIDEKHLAPNELIHHLLKAPTDLLWNGGIGTYVKSSEESHAEVGDKANDPVRVNGRELRCKVFGEGGNLGMTQLGRVEFCRNGGACNTDFIDNSAGVDCSDHEVNIKIALSTLIKSGDLDADGRNTLLEDMTDEVAEDVLANNYRQSQAISLSQSDAIGRNAELIRFIHSLENAGRLDRTLEFLPSDDELSQRQAASQGLTRPELAILISYAKVGLKEDLACAQISDDSVISPLCERAFPGTLRNAYPHLAYEHQLRRQIIATQLANDIVNTQGCTFVQRMQDAAGVDAVAVARAYVLAKKVGKVDEHWREVEALDYQVSADVQLELMKHLMRRVRRNTRWFLRNRRGVLNLERELENFKGAVYEAHDLMIEQLTGAAKSAWQENVQHYIDQGVPEELAHIVVSPGYLYSGLGAVDIANRTGASVELVCELYMKLVSTLGLNGFAQQLSDARVDSYWQAMAREAYMDDLESQVRSITSALVAPATRDGIERALEAWGERHTLMLERWNYMVTQSQATDTTDYAMFAVALRELLDLAQVTRHSLSEE